MRYVLDAEDAIRILGETEKQIELDSGKRMLFFALSDVESAGIVRSAQVDKQTMSAFCFTAADVLLGRSYEVLIPENHKDYVNFKEALRKLLPKQKLLPPREALPPLCDGNGHHHA